MKSAPTSSDNIPRTRYLVPTLFKSTSCPQIPPSRASGFWHPTKRPRNPNNFPAVSHLNPRRATNELPAFQQQSYRTLPLHHPPFTPPSKFLRKILWNSSPHTSTQHSMHSHKINARYLVILHTYSRRIAGNLISYISTFHHRSCPFTQTALPHVTSAPRTRNVPFILRPYRVGKSSYIPQNSCSYCFHKRSPPAHGHNTLLPLDPADLPRRHLNCPHQCS